MMGSESDSISGLPNPHQSPHMGNHNLISEPAGKLLFESMSRSNVNNYVGGSMGGGGLPPPSGGINNGSGIKNSLGI